MLGNILEIKEESLNDRNFGIVSGRIQPTSQSLPRSYILHKGRVEKNRGKYGLLPMEGGGGVTDQTFFGGS